MSQMQPDIGDPVSTSALGGALRAHALRLAALVEQLGGPDRGRRHPPVPKTAAEQELVGAVADQLDRIGAILQGVATSGVERAARRRRLGEEADREDLDIDGTRVTERRGPSRADPTRRIAARDHLQELLNRVTAGHSRDLAMLSRELEASRVALRALAARAHVDAP